MRLTTESFRLTSRTAITRSLSDLENEVRFLGKPLPPGKYGKQELLDILAQANWEKKHPGEPLPDFEKPMLIQGLKDQPPEKQEEIWDSPSWSAEPKRNGIRCAIYLGRKSWAHSRNISVTDYLPEGLNRQLPWLLISVPELEGTNLDGEIISIKKEIDTRPFTKGKGTVTNNVLQAVMALLTVERSLEAQEAHGMPLRFVAYDILKFKGQNAKNAAYTRRREALAQALEIWKVYLPNPESVILNESVTENKRQYFADALKRGEEGIVLKRHQGLYKGGQTRTRDQLKAKREIEIDAVVVDVLPPKGGRFEQEGLLGGLEFAAKDLNSGKWYRVGAVSNVDLEFRRKWSLQDDAGRFSGVKPGLIGTVWEIQGHDWTKNIQLAHARIIRSRNEGPDSKPVDEATFDLQAVIRDQQSREGGEGGVPTPVPSQPPPNAEAG